VKGHTPWGRIGWILLIGMFFIHGCEASPRKMIRQAEQKFNSGDYLGALTFYEQVSEHYSKNQWADDALYWVGIIYYLYLKDEVKGLQAFQRLAKDYPASPFSIDSKRYSANILQRLNKTHQAIAAYQHLMEVSSDPEVVQESHYHIGEIYLEAGELERARHQWDLMLQNYPEGFLTDKVLYGMASTYYIRGQCTEALELLNRLVDDFPQSELRADARFQAASCLEEAGDLEKALDQFRAVEESYPNRQAVEQKIKSLTEKIER
jgi:TolA-binding protein